jgi:glyoxylase-like metal-dependent hydrolase (beta-lactamase superfamily II)
MRLGEPIDPRLPWVRRIHDLDQAWNHGVSGPRCSALERAGQALGDVLRAGPPVVSVRTLPLSTLLYPTKYAFQSACRVPTPYVVMTHRALLVQVRVEGEIRNILFNPTSVDAALGTPFFRKLADRAGDWTVKNILTKRFGSVEEQLARLGLTPADIDVIAFDHFHVQDLRPLLGTRSNGGDAPQAGLYPRALLIAPRREWEDWDDLHPMQQAWFVRDGKRGVPAERVVLTDGDLSLGPGALLVRTPGHTSGNQTLIVRTESGVFGCSENGVSVDNWAPLESAIPGLREAARFLGVSVILNANTPESGMQQYTSMMLERSLVDRVPEHPALFQMFPSSELTVSWLAPGIRPARALVERSGGQVVFSAPRRPTGLEQAPAATAK